MSIDVRNLSKRFGRTQALQPLDLHVASGELLALLGPSGCGKTTLLRSIAGLVAPDTGQIHLHGVDVSDMPVQARGVGFVFQHYALFRHMSVFENVAFGLRSRPRATRPNKTELGDRVNAVLKTVRLDAFQQRYPEQLSGGQRQRVALARALVIEPRVLLLDEPFGALDAQVRRELRRWLRQLHDELKITTVFVTHDQEEALDLADRVVLLNQGAVVQSGSSDQLYMAPASAFVCDFLGETNHLQGELRAGQIHIDGARWPWPNQAHLADGRVDVCVRPHDFRVVGADSANALQVTVQAVRNLGGRARIDAISASAGPINIDLPIEQFSDLSVQPGAALYLTPARLNVFAV